MAQQSLFWISLTAMLVVFAVLAAVKIYQGGRGWRDSPAVDELPQDEE